MPIGMYVFGNGGRKIIPDLKRAFPDANIREEFGDAIVMELS